MYLSFSSDTHTHTLAGGGDTGNTHAHMRAEMSTTTLILCIFTSCCPSFDGSQVISHIKATGSQVPGFPSCLDRDMGRRVIWSTCFRRIL